MAKQKQNGKWNNSEKAQRLRTYRPFRDNDADGVPNWKDCQPLNPLKQGALDWLRRQIRKSPTYKAGVKARRYIAPIKPSKPPPVAPTPKPVRKPSVTERVKEAITTPFTKAYEAGRETRGYVKPKARAPKIKPHVKAGVVEAKPKKPLIPTIKKPDAIVSALTKIAQRGMHQTPDVIRKGIDVREKLSLIAKRPAVKRVSTFLGVPARQQRKVLEKELGDVQTLESRYREKGWLKETDKGLEFAGSGEYKAQLEKVKVLEAKHVKDGFYVGDYGKYQQEQKELEQLETVRASRYEALTKEYGEYEIAQKEYERLHGLSVIGKYERKEAEWAEPFKPVTSFIKESIAYAETPEVKKETERTYAGYRRLFGLPSKPFKIERKAAHVEFEYKMGIVEGVAEKPLKTVVTTAAFIALPPALKGIGKVAKPAVVAGTKVFPKVMPWVAKWTPRAVGAGLGGAYTVGTGLHLYKTPPELRVREFGKITGTELLPMVVGYGTGTQLLKTKLPHIKTHPQHIRKITKKPMKQWTSEDIKAIESYYAEHQVVGGEARARALIEKDIARAKMLAEPYETIFTSGIAPKEITMGAISTPTRPIPSGIPLRTRIAGLGEEQWVSGFRKGEPLQIISKKTIPELDIRPWSSYITPKERIEVGIKQRWLRGLTPEQMVQGFTKAEIQFFKKPTTIKKLDVSGKEPWTSGFPKKEILAQYKHAAKQIKWKELKKPMEGRYSPEEILGQYRTARLAARKVETELFSVSRIKTIDLRKGIVRAVKDIGKPLETKWKLKELETERAIKIGEIGAKDIGYGESVLVSLQKQKAAIRAVESTAKQAQTELLKSQTMRIQKLKCPTISKIKGKTFLVLPTLQQMRSEELIGIKQIESMAALPITKVEAIHPYGVGLKEGVISPLLTPTITVAPLITPIPSLTITPVPTPSIVPVKTITPLITPIPIETPLILKIPPTQIPVFEYPPYERPPLIILPFPPKPKKKKGKDEKKKKAWEWLEEFTVQRPEELHFGAIESGIPKVSKVVMLPTLTMDDITPNPKQRKAKSLKGSKSNRRSKKK